MTAKVGEEQRTMERNRRKIEVGVVTSDRMQKTITVRAERLVKHPLYKKYVRRFTTFKAHDENEQAAKGDRVEIQETRPYSKTKRWRLLRVLDKARDVATETEAEPAAEESTVPASEDRA